MTPPSTPARRLLVLAAAFCVVVVLAILAGKILAGAERPGGATAFDSSITTWVVAHRTGTLTALARGLSTIGSQVVLLPLTAVVAILLVARRELLPAAVLVSCWAGGLALYSLTKPVVQRHRPPADIWLTQVHGSSFPSGHATQSLATIAGLTGVAMLLWRGSHRRGPHKITVVVTAAIVIAGIGASRVYLGVHWTTDVLAGWIFAALWVLIVAWVTPRSARRRLEPEQAAA